VRAHTHAFPEEHRKVIQIHVRGMRKRAEANILVQIRVDEFKDSLQPCQGQAATPRGLIQLQSRVTLRQANAKRVNQQFPDECIRVRAVLGHSHESKKQMLKLIILYVESRDQLDLSAMSDGEDVPLELLASN